MAAVYLFIFCDNKRSSQFRIHLECHYELVILLLLLCLFHSLKIELHTASSFIKGVEKLFHRQFIYEKLNGDIWCRNAFSMRWNDARTNNNLCWILVKEIKFVVNCHKTFIHILLIFIEKKLYGHFGNFLKYEIWILNFPSFIGFVNIFNLIL